MTRVTLLMDIGNVLLRVDPDRMTESLAAHGIRPGGDEARLLTIAAEAHERGSLDTQAFLNRVAAILELEKERLPVALEAWNAIFLPDAPIPAAWNACRAMKRRGARIVLFSNTNETHLAFMRRRWPELFSLADDAVYSCAIHALKPETAFYEHALRRLNLRPETTFYFDDRPENVAGGLRHGFQARLFNWRDAETAMLRFLREAQ